MKTMANAVMNSQSSVFTKHQANISSSLIRRVKAAKTNQNSQLLTLLEQEQKELDNRSAFSVQRHFWDWLNRPSYLDVKQVMGSTDAKIWRACDSRTGEIRYAQTEAEIIDWIESNY